jgi:hypothetical protein
VSGATASVDFVDENRIRFVKNEGSQRLRH